MTTYLNLVSFELRNTFHDGDCFHNIPEIANDGISHIGANGYHFDNDNCSHILLATNSHLCPAVRPMSLYILP